jgi:hypothetical protein
LWPFKQKGGRGIKFDAKDFAFSESCNGGISFGEYNGKTYVFQTC